MSVSAASHATGSSIAQLVLPTCRDDSVSHTDLVS